MANRSQTIVRAWNAEGYHRDILVIDSTQVHMSDSRVKEWLGRVAPIGPSMSINPKDFPEMTSFEVIVHEFR